MTRRRYISLSMLLPAALLLRCTGLGDLSGAGSETTNSLAGVVVNSDGTAAVNILVRCIPYTYDCVKDPALPDSLSVMTDEYGAYRFDRLQAGTYNIFAVHDGERTMALLSTVTLDKDTALAQPMTLRRPGSIKVLLPDGVSAANGYVYIPGTIFSSPVFDSAAVLDTVPAGTVPALYYSEIGETSVRVIKTSITVSPALQTVIADYHTWKYSQNLFLNTTAAGAGIAGSVTNFPVLVRLTASNFSFYQAAKNGSDIRFTKSDNSPLSYEIESWDSAGAGAVVWVKVDTVYGNSSAHSFIMYWGAPTGSATRTQSNSNAVFDTATGFQGVWHLGEQGVSAYDATGNRFHGSMNATVVAPGAVGGAQQFDGLASYVHMAGTANGNLNFPESSTYTLSAWVYADTMGDGWHLIAGKGHEQYYLKINPDRKWEFVEYHDKAGWMGNTVPGTAKSWKLLTGVRAGTRQFLYLDGVLADSAFEVNPDTIPRNTSIDFSIGKYLVFVPISNNGYAYFKGLIDEVRVANRPASTDWIRLCYMNQKPDGDALVVFGRKP
jgi:hypothetical protein